MTPEGWTEVNDALERTFELENFVDALAFDSAIARGDLASLEAAVGLYRGPLLAECAEEWVMQERQWRAVRR